MALEAQLVAHGLRSTFDNIGPEGVFNPDVGSLRVVLFGGSPSHPTQEQKRLGAGENALLEPLKSAIRCPSHKGIDGANNAAGRVREKYSKLQDKKKAVDCTSRSEGGVDPNWFGLARTNGWIAS